MSNNKNLRLIILLVMGMFLVSFASAVEFNNVKDYNKENKTMTIKESKFGNSLANVTLLTPQFFNVGYGSEQKVFEFEWTNLEDKDQKNIFSKWDFYDINNKMKKIDKEIKLKYKVTAIQNITDYKTTCIGEGFDNCNQEIIGYHLEYIDLWHDFNNKDVLKGQKVTIGGFAYVEKDEAIEWIFSSMGIVADQWASWNSTAYTGLTVFYPMNDTGTTIKDYSGNGNDGTTYNGPTSGSVPPTTDYGSYHFNAGGAIDEYINSTTGTGISGNDNRSAFAWVNLSSVSDEYIIFMGNFAGNEGGDFKVSNQMKFDKFGASGAGSTTLSTGQWYFIGYTYDGTTIRFYLNGTADGTYTPSGGINTPDIKLSVGATGMAGIVGPTNGNIGGVQVWNRTLSTDEIADIFHNSFFSTGPSAPTINITSPENTTYTSTSINLNFTNDTEINPIYYNLNGAGNTSITSNTTITGTQGLNSIILYGNNSVGLWGSDIEYFSVDSLGPQINITSPQNGTTYNYTNISLIFDTYDLTGVSSVWYNWNGTNFTYQNTSSSGGLEFVDEIKFWSNGSGYSTNTEPYNISNLYANISLAGNVTTSVQADEDFIYFMAGTVGSGYIYQVYRNNWTVATNLSIGTYSFSAPAIRNGYIYFGDINGVVRKVEQGNVSNLIASYTTGGIISKALGISDDFIYVPSHDNKLYQLYSANLTSFANYTTGGPILSMPSVANGYVYFGNNAGIFYQLNASNVSQLIASYNPSDGDIFWKPIISSEFAYFGTQGSTVYTVNASNVSQLLNSKSVTGAIHSPGGYDGTYIYQATESGFVYKLWADNLTDATTAVDYGNSITEAINVGDNFVFVCERGNWDYIMIYKSNLSEHSRFALPGIDCATTSTWVNGVTFASDWVSGPYGHLYVLGNVTNGTNSSSGYPVVNFSAGSNTINVWSNDTLGNIGFNTSTFTVTAASTITITQTNPANATNQSSSSPTVNWTVLTDGEDLSVANTTLWLDDVVVSTNTSGINGSYLGTLTLTGGDWHKWKVTAYGNNSVQYNSSERYIAWWNNESNVIVNLISPSSGSTAYVQNNYLSSNVTSVRAISNYSLYTNLTGSWAQTNTSSSAVTSNDSFLTNITEDIIWNVLYCDSTNVCNYSATNYTLFKDATAPIITLTSPVNESVLVSGESLFLNWTVTDDNPLLECYYTYGVSTDSVTCDTNTTSFNWTYKINNLTFYARDVMNNLASSTIFWDADLYVLNETYNTTAIETTNQSFQVELEYNSSEWTSIIAKLVYNGTNYTSTQEGSGDLVNFSASLSIPVFNETKNVTFNWIIILTNSTASYNLYTDNHTQLVSQVIIALCNYSDNPQLYFETYSTTEPTTPLNATFSSAWTLRSTSGGSTEVLKSYEDLSETASSWGFCIEPNSTAYTVSVDIEVDATDYTPTYHYIVDTDYTSSGENISIYLLNDSLATLTELLVTDLDFDPIQDVYITIQRYDLGTDTYYNVAMARTDSDGTDLAYFNWYDSWYKFILVYQGEVVHTEGPKRVSESPQTFRVGEGITNTYSQYGNILYDLTFNNATNNFVLTYVEPSGEVSASCLKVLKRNVTNDYLICDTCESSSSATIYCNIEPWGNGTFFAQFYAYSSPRYYIDLIQRIQGAQNELYNLLGNDDGTGMAIIVAGIVLTMFLITPALGVLGAILGMLLAVALGFQPLDMITYVGIVIVGGAVMWAVDRR